MGEFLDTMKEGFDWLTVGMYLCGAAMTGLATAATIKGYHSADLWLGAGLLDMLALVTNWDKGRMNKQYQL